MGVLRTNLKTADLVVKRNLYDECLEFFPSRQVFKLTATQEFEVHTTSEITNI